MPNPPDIDKVLDRMMIVESGGRADARGKAGEIGLMQIKPEVAKHYGIDAAYLDNPIVNRYVARRYLSDLAKEFYGDLGKAIAAYNAGPARVRSGHIPLSTRAYVKKALGDSSEPSSAKKTPSRIPYVPVAPDKPSPIKELPSYFPHGPSAVKEIPSRFPDVLLPLQRAQPTFVSQQGSPLRLQRGQPSPLEQPTLPRSGGINNISPPWPRRILGLPSAINQKLASGSEAQAAEPPSLPYGMVPADLPPGMMIPVGGGPPVPIPKEASAAPAAPARKTPWEVEAADWLPPVGQFAGETLGALGTSGAGPLVMAGAAGLGGGGGAMAGEELRNLIRRHYGYPERTPSQVANSGLWSGLGSIIGVPTSKAAGKAAPVTAKAAIRAKRGYEAAQQEATEVSQALQKTLGVDQRTAEVLATDPAMRRPAQEAYFGARRAGFDRLSTLYQGLLGKHFHKQTPLATEAAIKAEMSKLMDPKGINILQRIEGMLEGRPGTVRTIHALRSEVRAARRGLNPQTDRDIIGALSRVETAATRDLESQLTPAEASALRRIDSAYGDYSAQFPPAKSRAISSAPNSPEVIKQIIGGKNSSSQIATLLDEIRRLPPTERIKSLTALRRAFASYVHDTATEAPNELAGLKEIGKRLNDMPTRMFDVLFGRGSKENLLRIVDGVADMHEKFLKEPSLAQAVVHEMRQAPESWLMRHASWIMGLGLFHAVFEGDLEKGLAETVGLWLGVYGVNFVVNHPQMQRLYLQMVTSKTAPQIAIAMRALTTAAAAEAAKSTLGAQPTGREGQP